MKQTVDVAPGPWGWPIERRTFLKALGLSGVGLLTAGSLGPWARSLWAAEAATGDSIDELALALEFDTERIFRFVSEQIRYEPYAGVLRGPRGTLMARAGNSADQAVLLVALLRASGIESRLVSGALAPGAVAAIMRAASPGVEAVIAESDAIIGAAADTLRKKAAAAPDDSTRRSLAEARDRQPTVETEVARRLSEGHARLVDALREAGIPVPDGVTPMPGAESSRHVWVQAARGSDRLDLDPVLPDQPAGARLAEVTAVLDGQEDLPRHHVTFRVVGESVSAGALRTDVLLEHTTAADELVGRRITFALEKPEGLKSIGAAIEGSLGGGVRYLPILLLDENAVLPSAPVRLGGGEDGVGGEDVFGGALANGPADGDTTALWLEISVESPGAPTRTARRTIFDRIGDEQRLDGSVDPARIGPVELVDLDETAQREYLPCRTVYLISVAGSWTLPEELIGSATEPPFGYDALAAFYHWMREGVAAGWAAPLGARPFCDGPNVSAVVLTPSLEGGELGVAISVDLLSRSLGTLGVDGVAAPAAPGVLAGVVSHVAERMLLGDIGDPTGTSAASLVSVGRVFEEAERQSIPLVLLDGASPDPVFDHPGGVEAARLISAALREGYVVIVPERAVTLEGTLRLGWWLVDPATGATLDVLDTGAGATLGEWAEAAWTAWRAAPLWLRLALCATMAYNIAVTVSLVQDRSASSGTKALVSGGGNALGVPLGAACGA